MRHRFASMRVPAIVVAVVSLAPVGLEGQGQPTKAKTIAAKTWTLARMPWGDPDLQGIWNNSTITPIERPKELAGKQVLADDEVAVLEEQAAQSRVDRPAIQAPITSFGSTGEQRSFRPGGHRSSSIHRTGNFRRWHQLARSEMRKG